MRSVLRRTAPEAALTLLIPLGLLGLHYIILITTAIIALLLIVYFFLSSDHRGRIQEAAAPTPWRATTSEARPEPPGRRGFADRLHSYRGGGHLGRRRPR